MKCIHTLHTLLFSRRSSIDQIPFSVLWRYLKTYCDSVSKVAASAVNAQGEGAKAARQLLASYDHCVLRWSQEIASHLGESCVQHQLEIYFEHVILMAITKAIYYQRINNISTALAILDSVESIFNELKKSLKPRSLHICGRYIMTIGNIYMDCISTKAGLWYFFSALKYFSIENEMLCKDKVQLYLLTKNPKRAYLLSENVMLCITI